MIYLGELPLGDLPWASCLGWLAVWASCLQTGTLHILTEVFPRFLGSRKGQKKKGVGTYSYSQSDCFGTLYGVLNTTFQTKAEKESRFRMVLDLRRSLHLTTWCKQTFKVLYHKFLSRSWFVVSQRRRVPAESITGTIKRWKISSFLCVCHFSCHVFLFKFLSLRWPILIFWRVPTLLYVTIFTVFSLFLQRSFSCIWKRHSYFWCGHTNGQ